MIGKYIEIKSGFAFDSNLFNSEGKGLPLIRIRDVGKNKSETYFSGSYSNDFIVRKGDLLVGMDGDFRISEWLGENSLLNQRVCKVVPKDDKIDKKYLLYALPKELKKIEDSTSFATVKHLSVKKINEIQIPLPPLEEQKRIAAILGAADLHRQKTKALLDKYDELAQALFLDMFGDPVTNCFAPLNNRTQFQNYFCNYVYGKEELFKTGEIKDSQRGIRKRLETYSGKVQFVSYYLLLLETEVFCIR